MRLARRDPKLYYDGLLVADIVAELAQLHGQPFDLVLDGPAGGIFRHGRDGEHVEIDAIYFIRTLACCWPGSGVRSNPLPRVSRLPPHHHITTEEENHGHRLHAEADGITPDQYDTLRETVGRDRDVPAGMRFHVASFGDGILRMTDVWDSEELSGPSVQTRILPGLRQSASRASPT